MTTWMFTLLLSAALVGSALSCENILVKSRNLGSVKFSQIHLDDTIADPDLGAGRPAYMGHTSDSTLYFYFTMSEDPRVGNGRWVINRKIGPKDSAVAYVNSWAITPYLVHAAGDLHSWMVPTTANEAIEHNPNWEVDRSLNVTCIGDDRSIYFDSSSHYQPHLTGFFVERRVSSDVAFKGIVYTQIRKNMTEIPMYMYRMDSLNFWLIGEDYKTDSAIAFCEDSAYYADEVSSRKWKFVSREDDNTWVEDFADLYSVFSANDPYIDVYTSLRRARSLSHIPGGQQYLTLRNGIPIPTIGLGTGGIYPEDMEHVIRQALTVGYRLFDSAREYHNEHVLGSFIENARLDESLPMREELFIESKVWPTDLGYFPTSRALDASLKDLQSNYVDLYLLHWPSCDPAVSWMHCETTVDRTGTWRESWRALERAYAEGRVMSIGVSNFDINLLQELKRMAVVLPHVVQNWAEPGHVDLSVREWCEANGVIYQPYASLRNLARLPTERYHALLRIAAAHSVSIHAVAHRFFLQTGAATIPRASKEEHMIENLDAFRWHLTDGEMQELGWNRATIEFEEEL